MAQSNGYPINNNEGYLFTFNSTSHDFAKIALKPVPDEGCEEPTLASNGYYVDGSHSGSFKIKTDGNQASWQFVELNFYEDDGITPTTINLSEFKNQFVRIDLKNCAPGELIIAAPISEKKVAGPPGGNGIVGPYEPVTLLKKDLHQIGFHHISSENDDINTNDYSNGGLNWDLPDDNSGKFYTDSTQLQSIWIYFNSLNKHYSHPNHCDFEDLDLIEIIEPNVRGSIFIEEIYLEKTLLLLITVLKTVFQVALLY